MIKGLRMDKLPSPGNYAYGDSWGIKGAKSK